MKKRKIALILLIIGGLFLALSIILTSTFRANGAGLLVESDTPAQVYVNGDIVGRTPLKVDLQSGEVTVKVVPDAVDKPLLPYETKVILEPGIQTVIRRVLGENLQTSAGEVISFKKIGGSKSSLAVVSTPDGAKVTLDNQVRGTTPITISELSSGVHQLSLTATGYHNRDFSIKTVDGYRVTAIVDLAVSDEEINSVPMTLELPQEDQASEADSTPQPQQLQKVEILTTPVGFLRVRQDPTTTSAEIGRVDPGDKFDIIEKTSGWFKIELADGSQGWVSEEFATVSANLTP